MDVDVNAVLRERMGMRALLLENPMRRSFHRSAQESAPPLDHPYFATLHSSLSPLPPSSLSLSPWQPSTPCIRRAFSAIHRSAELIQGRRGDRLVDFHGNRWVNFEFGKG